MFLTSGVRNSGRENYIYAVFKIFMRAENHYIPRYMAHQMTEYDMGTELMCLNLIFTILLNDPVVLQKMSLLHFEQIQLLHFNKYIVAL